MLLNSLKTRIRKLARSGSEEGAAIITVIGVSAVLMLIMVALLAAVVTAASFSSTTRAGVQARAAAESGITHVWTEFNSNTFSCTKSASGSLNYEVTIEYFDASGTALNCAQVQSHVLTPTAAKVTATGTSAALGIAGASADDQKTVLALFNIEVHPGTVNLDKAVFSDGSATFTNVLEITDPSGTNSANLYSNESIICKTPVNVKGWINVQGDFTTQAGCAVAGSIWTGGIFDGTAQTSVGGSILSAGLPGSPARTISLKTTFVGASVVSNGPVLVENTNPGDCVIFTEPATICGTVMSIDGGITFSGAPVVGGNVLAHDGIAVGNVNTKTVVRGNVVSSTGGLSGSANGNGKTVIGYVAVAGNTGIALKNIGNPASSCALNLNPPKVCAPAQPELPLAGLPPELNFPTNSRVVAPPRESMPRIDSDPTAIAKWTSQGWTAVPVACAAAKTTIDAGWTGKMLLVVSGCTDPIEWIGTGPTLTGDLAIINPSGFFTKNNPTFRSDVAGVERELMLIVPSDAKLADGVTSLVTWTTPIATDPSYTKPVCVAGDYGDIETETNLYFQDLKTFLYTPCDLVFSNGVDGFVGQMYGGTVTPPGPATMTFEKLAVPGATTTTSTPAFTLATQTARFDVRN